MKISPPEFPTWMIDDSMAHGMSLRDYFAISVLHVLIANEHSDSWIEDCKDAYAIADNMLIVREQ